MNTKVCRSCKLEKPVRHFWVGGYRPDRLTVKCEDCRTKTAHNRGIIHIRPDHLDESYIYCYKGQHWVQKDTEIYKSRAQKRGYSGTCIRCDKGPMRNRGREYDRELRAWVSSQKEGLSCTKCKVVYPPSATDWHHRNPATKLFSISRFNQVTKNKDRILEEIAKCDLYCANCHRIKHDEEGWRNQYS